MSPLHLRLGQVVRELRGAAGFSQESFAAHAKVHRTFMGSIERGKTNVSLDTLERLATGLDMTIWELMRIVETGQPSSKRGGSTPTTRKVAEDPDR